MRTGDLNVSGDLFCGTWQLVEDKQFTSAATSYTFSGLNGDTDQEYRMVCFFVNGYNGASLYYFRPNNDSTSANYGYQSRTATDTTAAAARSTGLNWLGYCSAIGNKTMSTLKLLAKSGTSRVGVTYHCMDISTLVYSSRMIGHTWNNTADNITSLVVISDQTDGIGAGSRVLLFKRRITGAAASTGLRTGSLNVKGSVNAGVMQKIYESTVSASTGTITISGLDGNVDVFYNLAIKAIGANPTTGTLYLGMNGVWGSGNYWFQRLQAYGTTVGADRGATSDGVIIGTLSKDVLQFSDIDFYAVSGSIRPAIQLRSYGITALTVGNLALTGEVFTNTASNITSLVLSSSTNAGIGVGTHVELWALRKKL